jgi:AcrR family transcriptional regulator
MTNPETRIAEGSDGRRANDGGNEPQEGSATRRRILRIALTLMSQRGVDGTSMRDLASAAGLNVASLYHYFPSKRELLEAVLVEQGFMPVQAPVPHGDLSDAPAGETNLAQLLADVLVSMFDVEEFVRLMVGEAIREETTARAVGAELFGSFRAAIEDWVRTNRPDLDERADAGAVARMLCAMVVGIFVLHASGVDSESEDDLTALSVQRAREAAHILRPAE